MSAVPAERRLKAIAVHVLTASGVVWALLALTAAAQSDWKPMFLWLGVALLVDGIDGPLARKVAIADAMPEWNGEVLDLVVDYLTYVFVPAYAAMVAGLFPDGFDVIGPTVMCLTAVIFFAKRGQKSHDNYFLGFPTVWNLVVFCWMLFDSSAIVVASTTILFGVLTFLPIHFVHPLRVKRFRRMTLSVVAGAAFLAILALLEGFSPDRWVKVGFALALVYLSGVSLWRTVRGETG